MKSRLLLNAVLFAAIAASASAQQTVLFDFGRNDGGINGDIVGGTLTNGVATGSATPLGGGSASFWNSVGTASQGQTGTFTGFVDTANSALTGWTIGSLTANMSANGYNNGGLSTFGTSTQNPTFANLGDFAVAKATGDYWFTGSGTASFTLSGLDNSKTYDFKFFGSRFGTQTGTSQLITTYSVDGLGAAVSSAALTTSGAGIGAGGYNGNNNNTVSITAITPDTGSVVISFTPTQGAFSYLNAMEITVTSAIPEPGTYAALAGAGALIFVALRRRRTAR